MSGEPQFPIPSFVGAQPLRPGANAHRAGLTLEQRVAALEAGAMSRPGPGVTDGSTAYARAGAHGRAEWLDRATPYYAQMTLNNSGAPTHTSNGGWQKVGAGGGTSTWTSRWDVRPTGVSAQVDASTNKRIDIRKTGIYLVHGGIAFNSISVSKLVGIGIYVNATQEITNDERNGVAGTIVHQITGFLSLTAGDYVELYAYQDDSASEAYVMTNGPRTQLCRLAIQYVGAAS